MHRRPASPITSTRRSPWCRDRSLITITALVALYRHNELPFHLKRGLENGVTKDEIIRLIAHLAFYAGWPAAMTALQAARRVFDEQRG